jgi:hypothetical protein
MNDVAKLAIYSTAAAGFSVAAHRSAARLGLPAAVVAIVGSILFAALARA